MCKRVLQSFTVSSVGTLQIESLILRARYSRMMTVFLIKMLFEARVFSNHRILLIFFFFGGEGVNSLFQYCSKQFKITRFFLRCLSLVLTKHLKLLHDETLVLVFDGTFKHVMAKSWPCIT